MHETNISTHIAENEQREEVLISDKMKRTANESLGIYLDNHPWKTNKVYVIRKSIAISSCR